MPLSEKKLQKAVEEVRKKGYLEVTIRFDAKKYLEAEDWSNLRNLVTAEAEGIFAFAIKILNAYKIKYG